MSKFPFLTKIVEVSWYDANGRGGWADRQDYESHGPAKIISVGYLLKRTKKFITLVGSQGEGDDVNQAMSIPMPWCSKIRIIRK